MIDLWDGFVITADEYQFILGRPKPRIRCGQTAERMTDTTYHATLGQALTTFYRAQLRASVRDKTDTLEQTIERAERIENRIMRTISKMAFDGPRSRKRTKE
jgi:hypothetical protein